MAFPTNPSPGDSYTDEYGTVWVYAGAVNGWYRQTVTTPNDTSYTAAISGPAGSNTQVQFNDNGELAGDSGLTYNKTTDALSGGAFIPTGSTVPSNGLYTPDTNQVALSTNGTGRLFVDGNGKVGINKAAPTGTLDVYAATSPIIYLQNSSSVANGFSISLAGSDTFVNHREAGNLRYYVNGAERFRLDSTGQLSHFGGGSAGSPAVGFNGSAPSNSLVITSAGLLGIGTSAPATTFHVTGTPQSTTDYFNHTLANFSSNTSDGLAIVRTGTQQIGLKFNSARNFVVGTEGASGAFAERMRIDSSGRVGIGTTGPQSNLEVSASEASITVAATAPGASGVSGSGWFRIRDNTNAYDVAAIRGLSENPTKLGSLIFYNAASGVLTERARLMAEGYFRFNAPSAQPGVVFQINSSEVARVDSSGRLLVGTSTAQGSNLLQIEGDTASAANPGGIFLRRGLTSAEIGGVVGRNLGDISFGTKNGDIGAQIRADSDAAMSTGDSPTRLVFSTTADGASSPTERMRINSNGFQASTSTANGIEMGVTASAGTSTLIFRGRHSATAGSYATGTVAFNVWSNGNVTNTNNSYGAISDIKLKENIVDANSQWNDLKALQVRNYNFKEGQTHTQIGLIAQEVELVSPGLVTESPDRDEDGNDLGTVTKSVNYSVLYMKAVKALQEAMERIETLEQRLNDAGIN